MTLQILPDRRLVGSAWTGRARALLTALRAIDPAFNPLESTPLGVLATFWKFNGDESAKAGLQKWLENTPGFGIAASEKDFLDQLRINFEVLQCSMAENLIH